jgi:hypothetical protein
MLGFDDTFELKLYISESVFLNNLLPVIDVEYNPVSAPFLSRGKLYYGHVKFNRFQLSVPNRVNINGTFESDHQSLTVKGQIVHSKAILLLNVVVTLGFLSLFLYSLLFNSTDNGTVVISAIVSIIGICNYCVAIIRLRKIKEDFIKLFTDLT